MKILFWFYVLVKCDADLVYNRCGPKVERTCDNAEDKSGCVAGCFCPNGMVKHEGKCVRLEKCPCTSDEGIIFKAGSETMIIGKIQRGLYQKHIKIIFS